jgi:hypothetical protein
MTIEDIFEQSASKHPALFSLYTPRAAVLYIVKPAKKTSSDNSILVVFLEVVYP